MIRKYLSQKYPYEENKWKLIIPISLFIALFMLIFQPFGLNELEMENKWLVLVGYGAVTFIILFINLAMPRLIFPGSFNDEKWNVWKEILSIMLILFTVGLGNLLYSYWMMGFHLTLKNGLIFQIYTLAVGIIPVSVLIILKQNYLNRKNRESAGAISTSLAYRKKDSLNTQILRITSDNEKDGIELMVKNLLFIKSEGNYITIGYLLDGKARKTLLRNTLKYASRLFSPYPFIYQCHRSWLVNMDRISRVTGNSQGLRIELEGLEDDIPVARKQINDFKVKVTEN